MRGILRATLFLVVAAAGAVLVGSGVGQWIPEERAPEDASLLSPGEDRITVDVRNAAGVEGLARSATDHLRGAGFDVVSLGNARTFGNDTTVVIDRVGETARAAEVARALGVARVTSQPDSNLFVDVTVRLGSDWSTPEADEEAAWEPLIDWLRTLGQGR